MASHRLKGFFGDIGLPVLARPVYICCTCFVINVSTVNFCVKLRTLGLLPLLQFIHHFWEPVSSRALWHVESSEVTVLLLLALHLLCWVLIASSIFTIDYLELIGIKQVRPSHTNRCWHVPFKMVVFHVFFVVVFRSTTHTMVLVVP